MSDFDEEAERERLREQYERDQKKREATEKMSDLLLKGATMTNAHCQECGDPIFRYDGREFCPTCQRIVADESDDGGDAEGDDTADGTGAGDADSTAADADAGARGPGDGTGGTADAGAAGETANGDDPHIEVKSPSGPPATTADAVDDSADPAPEEQAGGAGRPAGRPESTADRPGGAAGSGGGSDPGGKPSSPPSQSAAPGTGQSRDGASLSAARESLVRTLTAQARRAEACEDPRQVRDHLEAAREAAETLATLSS